MTKRHRSKFTDEFKAETVKLIRTSGQSIGSVARELNIGETVDGLPFEGCDTIESFAPPGRRP